MRSRQTILQSPMLNETPGAVLKMIQDKCLIYPHSFKWDKVT